jgi:hypothetical protein
MLRHRRPDRTRSVAAAGADRDRNAAAPVNQSDVSAISGANIAELLNKPISTPCSRAKVQRLDAMPAATKPRPSSRPPIKSGTITPKRSASRPMKSPPHAEADRRQRIRQRGASARATPNSACTAGNTTTTTYMLAPLMVITTSATASRAHA